MQSLARYWEEAKASGKPLVCMMIDADHFKEVNDLYGHDAGDRVLKELALTLRHAFRNDDMVCRLGGDEFLVICPKTALDGGLHIAEQTRQTVADLSVETGGEPWHGSISIGVAASAPALDAGSSGADSSAERMVMTSHEALIKQADRSVYAAKAAGKNCVRS